MFELYILVLHTKSFLIGEDDRNGLMSKISLTDINYIRGLIFLYSLFTLPS